MNGQKARDMLDIEFVCDRNWFLRLDVYFNETGNDSIYHPWIDMALATLKQQNGWKYSWSQARRSRNAVMGIHHHPVRMIIFMVHSI